MKRLICIILVSALMLPLTGQTDEPQGPPHQNQEPQEQTKDLEGPAPTYLTLEQCTKQALANSRTLAAERHRLAAWDSKVKQLLWTPFSNIKLRTYFTMLTDKCDPAQDGLINNIHLYPTNQQENPTGDQCTLSQAEDAYKDQTWGPKFEFSLKATIPIPTSKKLSAAKTSLTEAGEAKALNSKTLDHQIRLQVKQAFNAIIGAREMLYTIDKGSKHLSKARKKVEEDLENETGTATTIDLTKLKIFENEIVLYEAQAREIEAVALAALRFLVGGKKRSVIDIKDIPQKADTQNLADLKEYKKSALDNRPELKALKHVVKALKASVTYHRTGFLPDFAVVGGIGAARTPGRPDDINLYKDRDNYGNPIGFMAAVVMNYQFDIGLDIYRLREAKAELAAITIDQKNALEGIMLEVEKTYLHVKTLKDSLDSLAKSKRLVKGWINAASTNHATGLSPTKDVTDALKEYFKIMGALIQTTNDYNVALAQLERVTGTFAPLVTAKQE